MKKYKMLSLDIESSYMDLNGAYFIELNESLKETDVKIKYTFKEIKENKEDLFLVDFKDLFFKKNKNTNNI